MYSWYGTGWHDVDSQAHGDKRPRLEADNFEVADDGAPKLSIRLPLQERGVEGGGKVAGATPPSTPTSARQKAAPYPTEP